MASRSPDKPALVSAYRKLTGDTRTRVLRHAQQQWAGMDSWSDSAADQLVSQLLPVVLGGQRVVASATAAFLRTWLDTPGSRAQLLDLDQVTGTALRGVDPAIVYRRPVIESRATFARLRKTGLDRQQVIDAAIDTGLRRLLGTASTDLQLTATLTSRQVLQAKKVKVYRRVTRPGACPLCLAASDRVYHVADLLPIHSGCHCIVVPGGVLPEALQRAANTDDPTGGRGLQIGQNGEIGPVLEWGDKTQGAGRRRRKATSGGSSGDGGIKPPPSASASTPDEPEFGTKVDLDVDADLVRSRPAVAMTYEQAMREAITEEFPHQHERMVVEWLRGLGVGEILRVRNLPEVKTPDAVIPNGLWQGTLELKEVQGLNGLRGEIAEGSLQSSRMVIDVLNGPYTEDQLTTAMRLGVWQARGPVTEIIVRDGDQRLHWKLPM